MDKFIFDELPILQEARIVVVGVGNSGKSIINSMINEKPLSIELIIFKTDEKNNYKEAQKVLTGASIVFVVAGISEAKEIETASIIANIAKKAGALTIGIVSKYSHSNANRYLTVAKQGLAILNSECDSVIVIPNDKSLKIVDRIFSRVISGVSGVILSSSESDINLDIDDLKTIMCHQGVAFVGIGESEGENAAFDAINNAINFAIADDMFIKNVSGVLVHFNIHPEYDIMKLAHAMEIFHNNTDESTDIIFGTTVDKSLAHDFVHVTFIATGVEEKHMLPINNGYL